MARRLNGSTAEWLNRHSGAEFPLPGTATLVIKASSIYDVDKDEMEDELRKFIIKHKLGNSIPSHLVLDSTLLPCGCGCRHQPCESSVSCVWVGWR